METKVIIVSVGIRVEIMQLADPFGTMGPEIRFGVYVWPKGRYEIHEGEQPIKADFYEVWGITGLIEFLRKLYNWDACFPTYQETIE